MKSTRSLGMILLALYLILVGLSGLTALNLGQFGLLVPLLALVAGLLMLLGR